MLNSPISIVRRKDPAQKHYKGPGTTPVYPFVGLGFAHPEVSPSWRMPRHAGYFAQPQN